MRLLIPIGPYTKPHPYYILKEIFQGREDIEATLASIVPIPFVTSLEQVEESQINLINIHREKLSEFRGLFEEMGFKVIEKLIFSRDVVEGIALEANEYPYDMIILVKRKKLPRFIGRSISRSLIPKVSKPLLILTME